MKPTLYLSMKSRKKFLKSLFGLVGLSLITKEALAAKETPTPSIAPLASDPFIGTVALFAFDYPPVGWMLCNGSLLPISSYQELFSLLGTRYGGDGISNFALPDFRGRMPVGVGQGAGNNLVMGQTGGTATNTISVAQLPSHSHSFNVSANPGTSFVATGNFPANNRDGILHYGTTANQTMASQAISATGGGQALNNMPPFLGLNYCIAVSGVYPPRN